MEGTCGNFHLPRGHEILTRGHDILSLDYCLFLREQFSYSVVWCGIVPEPTARAYISPDKTIGKLFSREKTIIYY
jgi:hypothetical protein